MAWQNMIFPNGANVTDELINRLVAKVRKGVRLRQHWSCGMQETETETTSNYELLGNAILGAILEGKEDLEVQQNFNYTEVEKMSLLMQNEGFIIFIAVLLAVFAFIVFGFFLVWRRNRSKVETLEAKFALKKSLDLRERGEN